MEDGAGVGEVIVVDEVEVEAEVRKVAGADEAVVEVEVSEVTGVDAIVVTSWEVDVGGGSILYPREEELVCEGVG